MHLSDGDKTAFDDVQNGLEIIQVIILRKKITKMYFILL